MGGAETRARTDGHMNKCGFKHDSSRPLEHLIYIVCVCVCVCVPDGDNSSFAERAASLQQKWNVWRLCLYGRDDWHNRESRIEKGKLSVLYVYCSAGSASFLLFFFKKKIGESKPWLLTFSQYAYACVFVQPVCSRATRSARRVPGKIPPQCILV